jgi:ribonuclease Z
LTIRETEGGLVDEGDGYRVMARPMDHSIFALGYALIEDDRPGEFNIEKAQELGVPQGPLFGRLQRGQTVTLEGGKTVRPDDVLGDARRGRKFVHALDTRPCQNVIELAEGADLLVHDGMFAQELAEDARQMGHSTAAGAAGVAQAAGVGQLLLSHISQRYRSVKVLLEEARAIFPHTRAARDLMSLEIPLHR